MPAAKRTPPLRRQAADLLASAYDEDAAAAEHEARARPAAGPRPAAAARHRAVAARERARALRIEAAALTFDGDADAERQHALASAARENALAHEQFAEAELAGEPADGRGGNGPVRDGELHRAQAHMHMMWALAHQATARLAEACAAGPDTAGEAQADAPTPGAAELLEHETRAIARALAEHGPTRQPELARLVGARYWDPGTFRRALASAAGDGLIRRVAYDTYAAQTGDGRTGRDRPVANRGRPGR